MKTNFNKRIFIQQMLKKMIISCVIATFIVSIWSCKSDPEIVLDTTETTQTETLTTVGTRAAYPTELSVFYQGYTNGATYTQSNAEADLKALKFWDSNATLSIKTYDTANDYKGLRVKFPKDLYGGQSGVTAETFLADKNEYTLEYKVYFEPGFQFGRGNSTSVYGGGKLPGLCAGSRPGGCTKKTDGMSARIMFRKDERYSTSSTGGYLQLYQYWRNQAGSCGDEIYLQNCEAGRWYTIKMRVNLGSSTSDGNVKVWVNGVEKLNRNYRYLASGASWKLNGMMFHSFMGGNTSSWAPNADTYLMIDNYKVDDNAF
jgi:hypothetical protein